ncbi:MAG: hypothetical protein HGB12_10800 [Bacteroidetes bacterium]|nr:hypothetical protein [Bacteroidota bacterium]
MSLIFLLLLQITCIAKADVVITLPTQNSYVGERPEVKGNANSGNVWVIVHPKGTDGYWVQPTVNIENHAWNVIIYIGRSGSIDNGKHFEILAISDPKEIISEGDVLSGWPDAKDTSKVIEVIRR